MQALNMQLLPFFQWLLKTTMQGSVLICLILLVKTVLRGRLPIRWHYYLWLLLLIRLAMPWVPQSKISMFNLLPQSFQLGRLESISKSDSVGDIDFQSSVESTGTQKIKLSSTGTSDSDIKQPKQVTPPKQTSEPIPVAETTALDTTLTKPKGLNESVFLGFVGVLPLVWLIGALGLGSFILVRNFSLWRTIKRERPITDQKILDMLEDCKMQMGVQTILGVVVTDKVKSPALFGFIRPRLLLPEGLIETLSLEELHYVFIHELAHLKRRDIYLGWLISLLQVMHWFNPLVWFAFRRMRSDQELACDALALSTMNADEPAQYGQTIVNLFERFSQVSYVPSIAGILEDSSQIERRIKMIARFKKNSYRWSSLAIILIIMLGCVSLPDAERTKTPGISAAKPEPSMALRQVWSGPLVVDLFGEPSPDGRYLSYVDWETGDLAIYEIATGKKRRLTNKGSWDESDECADTSRWSPDGKQIAYCWDRQDDDGSVDLRVVGLDGSEPRILYSTDEQTRWVEPCAWFSDGKQILAHLTGKDGTDQIVQISVADRSLRVLKTVGKDCLGYVRFSPDGQYIAYDSTQEEDPPNHDITVISTDGTREISLVKHPAHDSVLGWAPDGKHILFASDRTGTLSVWLMAITDGKPQGAPSLAKPDMGRFHPMGFTRKGSFYYGISKGSDDVYIAAVDPESGKLLVPPKKAIKRFEGSNIAAAYSRDGKYLAYIYTLGFLSRNRSRRIILCTRSLQTRKEREFSLNLDYIVRSCCPRWSPDSESILIMGWDNKNRYGIYKIDVQTGEITSIVFTDSEGSTYAGDFSHDGKAIFYVRADRNANQILVRDLKTGKEKELYRSSSHGQLNISLSPDGEWLALRSGQKSLEVIPVAGGEPRELCRFEKMERLGKPITWTADGRYILFSSKGSEQDDWELCRILAEGGEIEKLGLKMNRFFTLSAHPDGQHLAFSSGGPTESIHEVWVMENFLPAAPVVKPVPQITLRHVWSGPGVDAGGSPSPDGRFLSYTDWETGDLAIRELATGKTRRLTKKGSQKQPLAFALNSVISPDNKLVAYSWMNQYGTYDLRLIGIDGSAGRTLYSNKDYEAYPHEWSSDGKHIAAFFFSNKDKNHQIVWVSVADGSVRVLKTMVKGHSTGACVSHSPDDRYIAYDLPVEEDSGNYDIYLLATDGGGEIPLVKHPANDRLLGWVHNREEILFLSDRTGTHDIWAIEVTDGMVQGPPRPITRDIGQIQPQGFTQDGSFYFNRYTRIFTTQIVPFGPETGKIQEELSKPLLGSNFSAEWSPDGESLAYVTEKTEPAGPGHYHRPLHIRNLKTGEERELAGEIEARAPRWSPDGCSILVTGYDNNKSNQKDYNGGVYKIYVQDGRVTELVQFPPVQDFLRDVWWNRSIAEWSLDGKAVFYINRGKIFMRELESGREKQLYRNNELIGRLLQLSPDGKRLAFAAEVLDEGKASIMVIPVSGGEPRELFEFKDPERGMRIPMDVAWTPDGNYILIEKRERKGSTVWRVPSKGGDPEMIWRSKDRVIGLSVHPNGEKIAVSTIIQEHVIWVMENFLPAGD